MYKERWWAEPKSETSLRFEAFSRKVEILTGFIVGLLLVAAFVAGVGFGLAESAQGILIWFAGFVCVPIGVAVLIERISHAAFRRRILREN